MLPRHRKSLPSVATVLRHTRGGPRPPDSAHVGRGRQGGRVTTTTTRTDALDVLRALVGRDDADFHAGQFEAIEALVDDRRRALVVQRTGWGKSAVYFVATMLLRRRGAGPTVLVSPLLALMRDQIAAAARAGVRAVKIDSTNAHEWREVLAQLDRVQHDAPGLSVWHIRTGKSELRC